MNIRQYEEYLKCASDPVYFIETYFSVITEEGIRYIDLYPGQVKLISMYQNDLRGVVESTRRSGKTTASAAYIAWAAIFRNNYSVAVIGTRVEKAVAVMDIVRLGIKNLPEWFGVSLSVNNKRDIELNNGSIIYSGSNIYTLRGRSTNFVYLDEYAFCDRSDQMVLESYLPVICSGSFSQLFAVSTPSGRYNDFYKLKLIAEKEEHGFRYMVTNR